MLSNTNRKVKQSSSLDQGLSGHIFMFSLRNVAQNSNVSVKCIRLYPRGFIN